MVEVYSRLVLLIAYAGVSGQNNHVALISDEAHDMRNDKSLKALACYALKARNRWCLTGTPMFVLQIPSHFRHVLIKQSIIPGKMASMTFTVSSIS